MFLAEPTGIQIRYLQSHNLPVFDFGKNSTVIAVTLIDLQQSSIRMRLEVRWQPEKEYMRDC